MTSLPIYISHSFTCGDLFDDKKITLNKIFYANRQRPMLQSLLVYWALMTMEPLLMGFVFISSTYLVSMAWFVKDIGMKQYLLSGLSLIFLTLSFFVVYQDIT